MKTIFDIVDEARKLSKRKNAEKLYAGEYAYELPNLHFDRHLYQPLLIAKKGKDEVVKSSPPGLNEGEKRFLEDLHEYWKSEVAGVMKGKELFVLRNLGRGKGIGFFESRGFYPDCILWLKDGKTQRIVFAEPHGMMLEQGGIHSEKIGLHRKLREHSKAALKKKGLKNLEVDAAVISVTPYDELSKQGMKEDGTPYSRDEFTDERVLFQERREGYDYVELLLTDGF